MFSDGRLVKTVTQSLGSSWKRPESGSEIDITVHNFCARALPNSKNEEDGQGGTVEPPSATGMEQAGPDLQLQLTLGIDETWGFSEVRGDFFVLLFDHCCLKKRCRVETYSTNSAHCTLPEYYCII